MSTNALIKIKDSNGDIITTIYKHYDGGRLWEDLQQYVMGFNITNGISLHTAEMGNSANGMECFAAQLVAHLKKTVGDVYLYSPKAINMGEEYIYTIGQDGNRLTLSVKSI